MQQTIPSELHKYINEWKSKKGSLIMVLRTIQDYYGYVPKDICFAVATELKVPFARIYEVLTFYNYFKLNPPCKYKIAVCMGTACYLKGAAKIIKTIEQKLNIKEGEISQNNLFTLESVRCMGCCGLAPTMRVNDKIYGKLDEDKVIEILNKYIEEG